MIASAADNSAHRFTRSLAAAWRPVRAAPRAEWIEQNIRFPPTKSGDEKRFSFDQYPYARGIVDALDDRSIRLITIMGATQIGKTSILLAAIASCAGINPTAMMLAGPDRDFITTIRDYFYELLEQSPAFRDQIPTAQQRNLRCIDFGPCIAHLAWSGSAQRLAGRACQRVFGTEVDRWRVSPREGRTAYLVRERVKAFTWWQIIMEGSPTDEKSAIALMYRQSDQRRFEVPCPRCGRYQELRFFPHKTGSRQGCGGVVGITTESGDFLTPDAALKRAFYRCERGCEIHDADKYEMNVRGVWAPRGQHVSRAGKLVGEPLRSPRHAGFQLSSLYSPTVTFGEVAAKWLEARDDVENLREFWNAWLGRRFTKQIKMPRWIELGRRLAGFTRRGVTPQWAIFLTAGADVQADCVYWSVRAWGEGGTSQLVDWGRFNQQIDAAGRPIVGSDLEQLDALLYLREFPIVAANPVGQEKLRLRFLGIDVNYRSFEVHGWSRRHPGDDRIRLVAGDPSLIDPWRLTIVEKSARDGKPYPGGLHRWGLNTDQFKWDVQQRWGVEVDKPGCWLLHADPVDTAETYLRQITNEGATFERDKRGRKIRRWEVIDKGVGNHYWDCEVYNRALAEMATGGDWTDLASRAAPVARQPARVESEEVGERRFIRRPAEGFLRR